MRKPLALLVFSFMALTASAASAQVSPAYQAELLGRKPVPAECADLINAAPNADNKNDYDRCQVTRLYLADIKNGGADKGRYPLMVDTTYAQTTNELTLLQARQHKYLP